MNSDSLSANWSQLVRRLLRSQQETGAKESTDDDGVYVSLDTLLDMRHSVEAHSKKTHLRAQRGLPGEILSNRKGPGIEFEDIRPYMPGDDIRHLDWRVTARTGMPYTRRYTEDLERHIMVVCDQRVNMFFGSGAHFKSYRAAVLAAKIAWFALARGHRLSGMVASSKLETVAVNSPRRAVLAYCNCLVNHNKSLAVDSALTLSLGDILDATLSQIKSGMSITVISDFVDLDQDSARALAEVARRSSLILRRIDDPLERAMTVRGRVGISDGVQMKQVLVSGKVRDAYQKKRAVINRQLTDLVESTGATVLDSDTGVCV